VFPVDETLAAKNRVNELLCATAIHAWSGAQLPVQPRFLLGLVLDARNFNTCSHLVQAGLFLPEQLRVPNPFEWSLMTVPPELPGLQILPLYSGACLARTLQPGSLALVYLDYTCTIEGCKRTRPLRELQSLFTRRLLADDDPRRPALLACTFHIPLPLRQDLAGAVLHTVHTIQQLAARAAQQFTLLEHLCYDNASSSMMMFLIGSVTYPPSAPATSIVVAPAPSSSPALASSSPALASSTSTSTSPPREEECVQEEPGWRS
jgi:hypothetical protein